jgi:hypothetical protein
MNSWVLCVCLEVNLHPASWIVILCIDMNPPIWSTLKLQSGRFCSHILDQGQGTVILQHMPWFRIFKYRTHASIGFEFFVVEYSPHASVGFEYSVVRDHERSFSYQSALFRRFPDLVNRPDVSTFQLNCSTLTSEPALSVSEETEPKCRFRDPVLLTVH